MDSLVNLLHEITTDDLTLQCISFLFEVFCLLGWHSPFLCFVPQRTGRLNLMVSWARMSWTPLKLIIALNEKTFWEHLCTLYSPVTKYIMQKKDCFETPYWSHIILFYVEVPGLGFKVFDELSWHFKPLGIIHDKFKIVHVIDNSAF